MFVKAGMLRVVLESENEVLVPVMVHSDDPDGPWQLSDASDYPAIFTLSPDPTEAKEGLYLGDNGYMATLRILD